MIQENHQQGFAGFADAFGDLFGDILTKKDVAAEPKKHEPKRERQPTQVETRARLTGERVREIVSDQGEELADFVESLVLDQREILERQHAAQLDQLSKIVALVSQMQGASHAETASLENPIREIVTNVVLDAAVTSEIRVDVLQRMVEESYKLLAAPLTRIVGEIFNNKALLMERYTRQSPGGRRCKVNMRKRRFGSTAQGGERG